MSMYKCGLVVGKFSPLHNGHIKVLTRATELCDELIIVSYTNPLLGFSDATRERWLRNMYPTAHVIVPNSNTCPTNDAPDNVHRDFTARLIEERTQLRPEVVFTSEDYGGGFAEFLGDRWDIFVEHEYVDDYYRSIGKNEEGTVLLRPVHATDLRAYPSLWDKNVPEFVRQTRSHRLCILGGESAGKTTLADALSKASGNHLWVAEYGRKFCEEIGGVKNMKYEDLVTIGKEQVKIEDYVVNHVDQRWVICDTSPLVTKFYSQEVFGKVDPELNALALRKYDMYFILGMSHGWHQDGDRMSPEFSMKQELWYWRQLCQAREDFKRVHFIDGPLKDRIETAQRLMETYYDN
jgi:HTH-type transcriptional repressor of NAD biosynthesis genes